MEWRSKYKGASKKLTKEVFNKYKACWTIKLEGVRQNLASSFDGDRVQTSLDNSLEDRIIAKADAEMFIDRIDSILRKLPGLYKKLMLNCFVREMTDIANYIDLGLPERTFYRCKSEAMRMFSDELIAESIKI